MANVTNNLLLRGSKGRIGKELVLRTSKGKTFSGKYPDMSGILPSKNQTKGRVLFAEAVKYARAVLQHPELYPEYKELKDNSLYNSAIKDYMHSFNPEKPPIFKLPKTARAALEKLSLHEAQLRALVYINLHKKLTNSLYRKMNGVSKPTASRHLRELNSLGLIKTNGGTGAGASYTPGSWWSENGIKN